MAGDLAKAPTRRLIRLVVLELLAHCRVEAEQPKNVFFAREDELINILSFRKMYYRFLKNKLVSIQGIKLLAIKNNNQIYPHNPDLFCKNQNFKISSFLTKIKIALYYAPECYWTFHKKKVVYLFLNNYLKNDLFNSPALYDYYFIYFIYYYI